MITLSPADIDRSGLEPQSYQMKNGQTLYYFVDNHIDLIRFDVVFEAGTSLQHKKMQSAAAIRLISEGTQRHSAREIAEFLDFRGIILEKNNDSVTAQLTAYSLTRYLDDLLPLLYEILTEPLYPQEEFDVFMSKRRQRLLTDWQKTSYVARNHFWEHLYGIDHPLGNYAMPEDLDELTVEEVREFHNRHHQLSRSRLVVSGHVTQEVLQAIDKWFSQVSWTASPMTQLPPPCATAPTGLFQYEMPQAVQNTLRVGRLLPFRWDDVAYAQFMVLSTLLGGYFGSRLMSNLREDKGYTYGIHSLTQVNRGSIVFYILTDVAADKSKSAMEEIMKEIARLRETPVAEEELQLVRNTMLGDFLRSIDGVFERAERYGQMRDTCIDEHFTDNYMAVLTEGNPHYVTPAVLQSLAQQTLDEASLLQISAGNRF